MLIYTLFAVFLFFVLHITPFVEMFKKHFQFTKVLCTTKTAAQESELCNSKLSIVRKSVGLWSNLKVVF